jgi:hypothetical protein
MSRRRLKARSERDRKRGARYDGNDPAAKAFGRKGEEAQAQAMTPERRVEIARPQQRSAGEKSR